MKVFVKSWTLSSNDHLWLEDSDPKLYIENNVCDGCGHEMMPVSKITNRNQDIGLVTGLCSNCGYVKRTRNLDKDWYNEHFSNKWLANRKDKQIPEYYVFNKISKYIRDSGRVLDFGCGIGERLIPFQEAGYQIYGVEPSLHRSAMALEAISSISTGLGEEYLENTPHKFDAIYFYNVLQFVENPFAVLEKAAAKLNEGGVLYFRVGLFYKDQNYCQFSHQGMMRSFLTLYSLKEHLQRCNLVPIEYTESPFELILVKKENSNGLSDNQIINKASKLETHEIKKFANKTLHSLRLKLLGKVVVKFCGREVALSCSEKLSGTVLPIEFIYDSNSIPILLK